MSHRFRGETLPEKCSSGGKGDLTKPKGKYKTNTSQRETAPPHNIMNVQLRRKTSRGTQIAGWAFICPAVLKDLKTFLSGGKISVGTNSMVLASGTGKCTHFSDSKPSYSLILNFSTFFFLATADQAIFLAYL